MTQGTSFEQTWISSPKGRFIPNINAFQPVVQEKIFEDSLFCTLLSLQMVQAQACFLPSLVEIDPVVLEKKSIKGQS